MTPAKVSAVEAIALVAGATQAGTRVLGLDGFTLALDGFRADLDLVLDVSDSAISSADAARDAIMFLTNKGSADVVWEVWTES